MKQRLGIFAFYDEKGIVDKYVQYLLADVTKCFSELVIICNGKLSDVGRKTFEQYSSQIFLRENTGYDVMAFREAIVKIVGWEKIIEYQEIVLLNDTFFGPFYSFEKIFEEMEREDVDFWGLLAHQESIFPQGEEKILIPTHLQSFFIVMRNKMLQDKDIQNYWNQIDAQQWKINGVVLGHEVIYTSFCEKLGFRWKEYIRSEKFSFEKPEKNANKYLCIPYELIKDYNFPIVKKKIFTMINPGQTLSEEAVETLEYIKKYLNYNIEMIYENLLRLNDLYTLKHILHWNYIMEEYSNSGIDKSEKLLLGQETTIIMCLHDEIYFEDFIRYLKNVPTEISKIIFTNGTRLSDKIIQNCKFEEIKNYSVYQNSNSNNNINVFFDIIKSLKNNIKYFCFIHDFFIDNEKNNFDKKSKLKNICDNLLGETEYIFKILKKMKENESLGILGVPGSFLLSEVGNRAYSTGKERQQIVRYLIRTQLYEEIKLNIEDRYIDTKMQFWGKVEIFKKFFKEKGNYTENLLMDKIGGKLLPLIAQSQLRYTGTVCNSKMFSLHYENLYYKYEMQIGVSREEIDLEQKQYKGLVEFCEKLQIRYIYGAGIWGKKVLQYLNDFGIVIDAFIVSDSRFKGEIIRGVNIKCLEEIKHESEKYGIIVALGKENRKQVLPMLRDIEKEKLYVIEEEEAGV